MSLTFLVLQHADWEKPGIFLETAAHRSGVALHTVLLYRQAAPDPADFDALILLGGPPNVHEEARYPFLCEEKRLIRAWLAMDRPCLGFCLGHQLLADALGASVGPNFTPSVGFVPGHLTQTGKSHPLFQGVDAPLPLFKWHAQAILTPLPRELRMLATSNQCVVEAFTVAGRPHIIGLQGDNHAAHPEDVRSWLRHDADWLRGIGNGIMTGDALVKQAVRNQAIHENFFLRLFDNFVGLTRSRRETG